MNKKSSCPEVAHNPKWNSIYLKATHYGNGGLCPNGCGTREEEMLNSLKLH
jgi:hypothetical protein